MTNAFAICRLAGGSAGRTLAALTVVGALITTGALLNAKETGRVSDSPGGHKAPASLEKTFWACDYAASTRFVGGDEGAMCGVVSDALRDRKFGGDFNAMLRWWQESKAAQHRRLAAIDRESAAHRDGSGVCWIGDGAANLAEGGGSPR